MDDAKFTFRKSERLTGEIRINKLYKEGKSFVAFPFFVKYDSLNKTGNTKILISVSKRRFKNATDRNLIKRRVREAYRLNKSKLTVTNTQIAFNYIANTPLPFQTIEQKMLLLFKRLNKTNTKD